MKKHILILVILVPFLAINVKSQTITAPDDVSLNLELTVEKEIPVEVLDTLLDPMSLLTSADTLNISVFMITADTTNLAKIHVKLGTTDGGGDLLTHIFDFDTTPVSSFTYERDGNVIKIGFGTYLYTGIFYCELFFEDTSGNNSDITKYNTN